MEKIANNPYSFLDDMTMILRWTIIGVVICSLTACGGKRTDSDGAADSNEKAVQQVVDITRPPEVDKNRSVNNTESNPDETISYEEWKEDQDTPGDDDQPE